MDLLRQPLIAKLNYVGRPIYITSVATFKLALCFEALRFVDRSGKKQYRLAIRSAILFITITSVVSLLVLLLYCQPVRKAWTPQIPGHCFATRPLFYGTSGITVVCDLIAFSLPVFSVLRLQLQKDKKTRLISLLLLGFLTTLCSILRMVQTETIIRTGDSTMFVVWGVIEMCIGVSKVESGIIDHTVVARY